MGCWGITAFESDAGLDAVGLISRPRDLQRFSCMSQLSVLAKS